MVHKSTFIQIVVVLQIQLKEIKSKIICKQRNALSTTPDPVYGTRDLIKLKGLKSMSTWKSRGGKGE